MLYQIKKTNLRFEIQTKKLKYIDKLFQIIFFNHENNVEALVKIHILGRKQIFYYIHSYEKPVR